MSLFSLTVTYPAHPHRRYARLIVRSELEQRTITDTIPLRQLQAAVATLPDAAVKGFNNADAAVQKRNYKLETSKIATLERITKLETALTDLGAEIDDAAKVIAQTDAEAVKEDLTHPTAIVYKLSLDSDLSKRHVGWKLSATTTDGYVSLLSEPVTAKTARAVGTAFMGTDAGELIDAATSEAITRIQAQLTTSRQRVAEIDEIIEASRSQL